MVLGFQVVACTTVGGTTNFAAKERVCFQRCARGGERAKEDLLRNRQIQERRKARLGGKSK